MSLQVRIRSPMLVAWERAGRCGGKFGSYKGGRLKQSIRKQWEIVVREGDCYPCFGLQIFWVQLQASHQICSSTLYFNLLYDFEVGEAALALCGPYSEPRKAPNVAAIRLVLKSPMFSSLAFAMLWMRRGPRPTQIRVDHSSMLTLTACTKERNGTRLTISRPNIGSSSLSSSPTISLPY